MESVDEESVIPEPVQLYFGDGEKQLTLNWDGLGEKPAPGEGWIEMLQPKPLSGVHYAGIAGEWLPKVQDNFELEIIRVDSVRRDLYSRVVSPLLEEARVKLLLNTEDSIQEAKELEIQALAAREKIQADHPWPESPLNDLV